jgi:hypothetical protein
MTMEDFRMPTLLFPFAAQLNPAAEALQAHAVSWVQEFQLVQKPAAVHRFEKMRFSWLIARAHPTAQVEQMQLLNDWLMWMFMLDDQFDEGAIGRNPERVPALMAALRRIVQDEAPPCSARPMMTALVNLWQRTRQTGSPSWRRRLLKHLYAYFDAYVHETQHRAAQQIPDLPTYLRTRQASGAMLFAFDFIEEVERLDLPDEVYESPPFQRVLEAANNLVCWINDLFSLPKEAAHHDVNNLVMVVQQAYGMSVQEAVERVGAMIDDELRQFQESSACIPATSSQVKIEVQVYVDHLQAWVRGIYDWSWETMRYSKKEPVTSDQSLSSLEDVL